MIDLSKFGLKLKDGQEPLEDLLNMDIRKKVTPIDTAYLQGDRLENDQLFQILGVRDLTMPQRFAEDFLATKTSGAHKRVLQVALHDGVAKQVAMEVEYCGKLQPKYRINSKLLILKGTPVKKNILMLKPDSFQWLGGVVVEEAPTSIPLDRGTKAPPFRAFDPKKPNHNEKIKLSSPQKAEVPQDKEAGKPRFKASDFGEQMDFQASSVHLDLNLENEKRKKLGRGRKGKGKGKGKDSDDEDLPLHVQAQNRVALERHRQRANQALLVDAGLVTAEEFDNIKQTPYQLAPHQSYGDGGYGDYQDYPSHTYASQRTQGGQPTGKGSGKGHRKGGGKGGKGSGKGQGSSKKGKGKGKGKK